MSQGAPGPYFPFYVQDFLVGVMDMSAGAVGGYIRLLCIQWAKRGLPEGRDKLMAMAGVTAMELDEILPKFTEKKEGKLFNKRLEKERKSYDEKCAKMSANADKRWKALKNKGDSRRCKSNATALQKTMQEAMPNGCIQNQNSDSDSDLEKKEIAASAAVAPPAKPPRPRNPIFDALVTCEGLDPLRLPKEFGGRFANAQAKIKSLSPDVTPEAITRRWDNMLLIMAHFNTFTANALANNWHLLTEDHRKDFLAKGRNGTKPAKPMSNGLPDPDGPRPEGWTENAWIQYQNS